MKNLAKRKIRPCLKKCIILSIYIITSLLVNGQQISCVIYTNLTREDNLKSYLVYNDSVAMSIFGFDLNQKIVISIAEGKNAPVHKSYFSKKYNSFCYWKQNKRKSKSVILLDTTKNYKWILIDTFKTIMNYNCKLAYHVSSKQDTLVAWYTTEILHGYGFYEFNGLPGLVLESISQVMNWHLVATKIEKIDGQIYFPTNLKVYYY